MAPQLLSALLPAALAASGGELATLICLRPDGCPEERAVLEAWADQRGVRVASVEALTAAGAAGGDLLAEYRRAVTGGELERALAISRDLPATLSRDELLVLLTGLGQQRLERGDTAGATRALEAAASAGARTWDLPPMSEPALAAYLDAAARQRGTGQLSLAAPGGRVFLDGRPVESAEGSWAVPEGWHRLSVEWPDRRAAWVTELVVRPGEHRTLRATRPPEDHGGAAALALSAALRGAPLPPEVAVPIQAWAEAAGLDRVLAVAVQRAEEGGVGERFTDVSGQVWTLDMLAIDAAGWGYIEARDPEPSPLRLELGAGHLQVGEHPKLAVDVGARLALAGPDLDLRLGVARGSEPLYLYRDLWLTLLPTAAAGAVYGGERGGWLGLYGLALVPWAFGAELRGGWAIAPAAGRRIALEARLGYSSRGLLAGAAVRAGVGG